MKKNLLFIPGPVNVAAKDRKSILRLAPYLRKYKAKGH